MDDKDIDKHKDKGIDKDKDQIQDQHKDIKSFKPLLSRNEYSDEQFYGPRKLALEIDGIIKLRSKSECVLYPIKTFAIKSDKSIKMFLQCGDIRIKNLFEKLNIKHALPIQRYSWYHIEQQIFPLICIAPRLSGKTYSHLIPFVTGCIRQTALKQTDDIIEKAKDSVERVKDGTSIEELMSKSRIQSDAGYISDKIDQDQFDFNALGQEDEPHCSTSQTLQSSNVEVTEHVKESELELTEEINMGPRYLIVCSSQQQMKSIQREILRMKEAAFGDDVTGSRVGKDKLPPVTRLIGNSHTDDKLAVRCAEAEILISTPSTLLKALTNGFVDYSHFEKIIYDDLDQTLQLHNNDVRELIKIYIAQMEDSESNIVFYARKWTELVRQLITGVFIQKNILFASLLEASIYANMRFELELYRDKKRKLLKLQSILKLESEKLPSGSKIAIICNDNSEAEELYNEIHGKIGRVILLPETSPLIELAKSRENKKKSMKKKTSIYITCDPALEIIFEDLSDVSRLIHYSIPDNIFTFDSRFRLVYRYIDELKDGLRTYILMDRKTFKDHNFARELYDVISRSTSTLHSTKLEMRDILNDLSTKICWRWATTGVCRLDKFGKETVTGSFCPNRHSLRNLPKNPKWVGQCEAKITITNILSPNEFYFWFEEYKNRTEKHQTAWQKFEQSGYDFMHQLQPKLDQYKDIPLNDVPLKDIKKSTIFGVYFHDDARVDRIVLIEEPEYPNIVSEFDRHVAYSIQLRAFKIDYGKEVTIYLRNLIRLRDKSLMHIPALAHRGFLVGLKPFNEEPYWSDKAFKLFSDKIYIDNLQDITVWIRFNEADCFWFENLLLNRKLYNFDGSNMRSVPKCNLAKEIIAANLAKAAPDPTIIDPSLRLPTISKWHTDLTACLASHAFLRRDKSPIDLFVLNIRPTRQTIMVRQVEFNRSLINLEEDIQQLDRQKKIKRLAYFGVGVYCLAGIWFEDRLNFNRCKITREFEELDRNSGRKVSKYIVQCLDHGDFYRVGQENLYLCPHHITSQLPYQSIEVHLADFNEDLIKNDLEFGDDLSSDLYGFSRDEDEELLIMKAILKDPNSIYLYVKDEDDPTLYKSLIVELEKRYKKRLTIEGSNEGREDLRIVTREEVQGEEESTQDTLIDVSNPAELLLRATIKDIVQDLVKEEMVKRGILIQ